MHDCHMILPLVAAILSLVLGLINLIYFVWYVQELMVPHRHCSNDNSDNMNITKFMRTFQQMVNTMQAQATIAKHMMKQLNSRFEGSVGGNGMDTEYHKFSEFRRANLPSFKRPFNPNKADEWIEEIEKIYSMLTCLETQKMAFTAYMLKSNAKLW